MLVRSSDPLTGLWTNPRLSEADARLLTTKIVEQIFTLGGRVSDFGISLQHEGFYFCAEINGQRVFAQTGQGQFTYQEVAAELLNNALTQRQTLNLPKESSCAAS